jgi:hypothetical protein
MYDCSPDNNLELDYDKTKTFLSQFNWGMINAFGFYGGEPSINTDLYDKFIELVPDNINRFVISNGVWSNDYTETSRFIKWCVKHRFYLIVSSTPEHIQHQHRSFLEKLVNEFDGAMELKKPDEIHAQGRARNIEGVVSDCKLTCQRTDRNVRLGLKPDGNIVFQNCHGEYHIIQTYRDSFDGILDRVQITVENCLKLRNKEVN